MSQSDQRQVLPEGNKFKYYAGESKPVIPEGTMFCMRVRTAADHEFERKVQRGQICPWPQS